MGVDTKTYWLTDRQSQRDFDFDFLTKQSSRVVSSFETPACRDISLGAEELSWQLQNNGKKGIRLRKEASCVIWSDSVTDVNPLPGYD
jgi:hypothetical protein